jgi:hypothetical protein
MSEKFVYFKLGPAATSFHDPKSNTNIVGNETAKVPMTTARQSETLKAAKMNGHIVEVDESEYTKKGAIKAPDQNVNMEGSTERPETELNRKDAPNAFKNKATAPGGIPAGPGGSASLDATADDDDLDEAGDDDDDGVVDDKDIKRTEREKQSTGKKKKKKGGSSSSKGSSSKK